jgi:hypothetical protein
MPKGDRRIASYLKANRQLQRLKLRYDTAMEKLEPLRRKVILAEKEAKRRWERLSGGEMARAERVKRAEEATR